jgi:hypothetical protein
MLIQFLQLDTYPKREEKVNFMLKQRTRKIRKILGKPSKQ